MSRDAFQDALVFPARAGMSLILEVGLLSPNGFPRPRGDEPGSSPAEWLPVVFSPPARG